MGAVLLTEAQLATALAILKAFTWPPDELPQARRIEHLPYAPALEVHETRDGAAHVSCADVSGGDVLDASSDSDPSFWIDDAGKPFDVDADGERFELALVQMEQRYGGHHYRATVVKVTRDDEDALGFYLSEYER